MRFCLEKKKKTYWCIMDIAEMETKGFDKG